MPSSFEIAVGEQAAPEEWIEFTVGGKTCRALAQPTSGQIAYVTLHINKGKAGETQALAMLNFIDSLLDDETQAYIMSLLLDTHNDFEVEGLLKILENLMETWSGRPTLPSADSSSSPTNGGQPSSVPTQAPTFSPYLPTGS